MKINTIKISWSKLKNIFKPKLEKGQKSHDYNKENNDGFKELVKTFAWAGLFAIIIRSFFYEPFHIPSSSMKPNLLIGDYIFVSKMSYGYSKYSFPFASFNAFDGRIFAKKPQRGDSAVFRLPANPKINYIKRIVGLPGDKIQIKNGTLYINTKEIIKVAAGDFIENDLKIAQFKEKIDDKEFLTLDQYQNGIADNTEIYQVPSDHYFVMGDNRDNSQDSRYQYQVGFIPTDHLIGRATIIFFSVQKPIWQFWNWSNSIRFDRILARVI